MTMTDSSDTQALIRHQAADEPVSHFLSPLALIRSLIQHRVLLFQLSRTSLSTNHRGSLLGQGWVVLDPLIMLGVYGFVFGMIFAGKGSRAEFVLGLYGGMLTYQIFSITATAASGIVAASRNFVKQMVFPVEILPASTVGGIVIPTAIGMVLFLLANLIFNHTLPVTTLLLPVVLIPIFLISLGLAWLFASLGVYIPDMRRIVALIAQIGFFLTPIIWPVDRFPVDWVWVVNLNPLTGVVEAVRAVVLNGAMPSWPPLIFATLFGLLLCQLGYAFFMKTKRGFADVL